MYVCLDCGAVYEEQPTRTERHGELDGNWYETFVECPCGGAIEKAVECAVCGEWYSNDDLTEGVCDYCMHRNLNANNVEAFADTFEVEKCSFEVNAILEHVFSSEEVNEILMREFKQMLHTKRMMPTRLEDSMKTYLQDDWANFLAELAEKGA